MMTDNPARVSPDDISTLLAELTELAPDASPAERLTHHERNAKLLSRIAAVLGTTDASDVAADAWLECQRLVRQIASEGDQS
jgi:hypothetical protein